MTRGRRRGNFVKSVLGKFSNDRSAKLGKFQVLPEVFYILVEIFAVYPPPTPDKKLLGGRDVMEFW